ncbi:hypothetical protein M513_00367 [Trichuris suis]|uniref:GIY-YIG domain-containing protein n=1 Tax=Trichuris suis TaxID=68888 RepID=A0A085MN78_9BILA|nr:hypothetical protein M513_00367 [Trichuris suis]
MLLSGLVHLGIFFAVKGCFVCERIINSLTVLLKAVVFFVACAKCSAFYVLKVSIEFHEEPQHFFRMVKLKITFLFDVATTGVDNTFLYHRSASSFHNDLLFLRYFLLVNGKEFAGASSELASIVQVALRISGSASSFHNDLLFLRYFLLVNGKEFAGASSELASIVQVALRISGSASSFHNDLLFLRYFLLVNGKEFAGASSELASIVQVALRISGSASSFHNDLLFLRDYLSVNGKEFAGASSELASIVQVALRISGSASSFHNDLLLLSDFLLVNGKELAGTSSELASIVQVALRISGSDTLYVAAVTSGAAFFWGGGQTLNFRISERLMVLAKTLNFRLFFKSSPNLRSILRNDLIKLPPSEKPGIVYEVKCDCSASYIGETGFTLRHRYKQHVQVLKRLLAAKWKLLSTRVDSEKESQKKIIEQCKKDSAVAAHAASCLQRLYPHVVCHEANYKQRKIKEALYIRQNTTINRDQGMEVSDIWLDLLRRTRSCLIQAP